MDQEGENTNDHDHRLLQEFLARRDYACPACRYNLCGLTSAVCPECGNALRLQVGTVTPRFALFLLLMSPLLVMVGIGLIFGLVAVTEGLPPGWSFYFIESAAALDVLACIALYRLRYLFLRRTRKTQIELVVMCWLLHIFVVVVSFRFGGP